VANNFLIQVLFSIIFVHKVAHTSLVFVVKISYQSKKLWVTKKHFSNRRFSHRCDFLLFFYNFLTFQNNFAETMSQLNDIFIHQCVCMLVLNHFTIKFLFCLSRFRVWISPPNVFLGKFQHLFSIPKHYNLPIYVVKWLQIWFTSCRTCTLQYCIVEIFIPYKHLDT